MSWSRAKVEGVCSECGDKLKARGLCDLHYRRLMRIGTLACSTAEDVRRCKWERCDKAVRACGYCRAHYRVARREGILHPGKYKRDHPLYNIWWGHKKSGLMSPEWEDFDKFVSDVGEKKSGKEYVFIRLRNDAPFGPNNFEWRRHLTRLPGEPQKAWHARKWQARKENKPGWDNDRRLKRIYGITREEYNSLSAAQNGVCAICQNAETRISHRTGATVNLTVDHNHKTGKLRGLLCHGCNVAIGHIGESIETLRAIETYLLKYQG